MNEKRFEGCDADAVFAEISKRFSSSEARALWERLRDEIGRKNIRAAQTYLDGEFSRLKQELETKIKQARLY